MEVILAIGIILAGLVGVTALVPVAARNAQVAMESDRSLTESTSAAALGAVHEFNDLDSLVIMDKPVVGSVASGSYAPSGSLRTIDWKINTQSNLDPPISGPLPAILIGKLDSPGYSHTPINGGLTAGVCIDPLGFPDLGLDQQYVAAPSGLAPFRAPDPSDSAFDASRFPYYNETYNPLAPPNQSSNGWAVAPRMWRATMKAPMYLGNEPAAGLHPPARRHQLLSASAVRSMFRVSGGLAPFAGSDDSGPRSILVSRTAIGGSIMDGSSDGSSEYTWFATLAPPFLGGNSFRQSIIVVRQRQAPVPRRANDPLALQKTSYSADDPDDNPSAERITWIDPTSAIGFSGGAGGDIWIYGSQAVADDIESNEWVMLSRQPHVSTGTWVPDGPAVHRWYRVVRVGEVETSDAFTFYGMDQAIWRRQITLAGPDWAFQDGAVDGGGDQIANDDTFCTIIRGAVSVIESEVQIQ